jgi:glycine cleavage system protein P-like pyridoxal-binding family
MAPAPFVPTIPFEQRQMLDVVGVGAVDDLFLDIPAQFRNPPTDLPPALSEFEVLNYMADLAAKNRPVRSGPSFLGGGFADHFIPSVVSAIISRGEFLTPYTPYQPEASQGILQALFEYQSAVCQLTGMDVSNTGMYDGASGLAEAALMACRLTRRQRVVLEAGVSPEYRRVLETYLDAQGIQIADEPDGETACLILQQPTYLGPWRPPDELATQIHDLGGLLVVMTEPVSLGLFRPPGDYGADIVVAEGQALGIALGFGGPGVGIFACRQEFLRQMPGRIVGRSVDARGRDAFVLTLQTREQHIRRERATSNICTAETLAAIALAVHVAALGPQGIRRVAEACYHNAHYAASAIGAIDGFEIVDHGADSPFFKEFTVRCPIPTSAVIHELRFRYGILAGLDVSGSVPNGLSVCVTETASRKDIDALAEALAELSPVASGYHRKPSPELSLAAPRGGSANETAAPGSDSAIPGKIPLLMDIGRPGRRGVAPPPVDVPQAPLPPVSGGVARINLELPEVSELDLVRYFTRLSQQNYSIDTTFYPLGSCTMKYNPKVNEEVARMPGFAGIHPFQQDETVQGALEVYHELQDMLAEIVGMDATSLAPSAGAHGELTGMLLFRAFHRERGNVDRKVILAPDSSHGTNPASAAMAGFSLATVPTAPDGNVDLDALQALLGPNVAGIMLTMPTTLGLFDPNTAEICRLVHEAGGLVYGDGANLNALLGRVRLGDLGFDIVHINVHKTFSTPHGGGGPGAGPVCVKAHLADYLPSPVVASSTAADQNDSTFRFVEPAHTIGRIGSAWGNFGVLVRAYTYLRMHGSEGLKEVSGAAVLNANYLRVRLSDSFDLPYDRICMHEAVFAATKQKREQGVKAGDICKRLLDYGFYAPTVYFPLIVDEALMIEPTETESLQTLDSFITAMNAIAREARDTPELVRAAPHDTPVLRIDEARAARQPDLRWTPAGRP